MDPTLLIIAVVAIGGMWLLSRRSKKQQQAAVSFRDHLEPGQKVMTGSGLFGTIVEVEDDRITLESGGPGGSRSEWLRAAIAKLDEPPVVEEPTEEDLEAEVAAADVDELLAGISAATELDANGDEKTVNPYAPTENDDPSDETNDPEADSPDDEDRKSL